MKLAREYKRPVLLGVARGFSTSLSYAIRQARERRELALKLRKKLREAVQPFALSASLKDDVETVGGKIRAYLGVNEAEQRTWKQRACDGWRLSRKTSRQLPDHRRASKVYCACALE